VAPASAEMCPVCSCIVSPSDHLGACPLFRCERCGHRFIQPAVLQSYDDSYHGHEMDSVFAESVDVLLREQFLPRQSPDATIVDVGCGNGAFLKAARSHGYTIRGVEVSESAARQCATEGIPVVVGDFPTVDFGPVDNAQFVTLWDVIEHLSDPGPFVARAAELCAPDGLLVVKAPYNTDRALRFATAVPRLAGPLLHVPSHIQFFTPRSLSALVRRHGFDRLEWVHVSRLRGARHGGSIRTRTARVITRLLHTVARDGNLLLFASLQKP
jgi:2-polyprenyl-3-methyl-5-hydroxy-6-metoxy-1,4-benzoquinol methylase